MYKTRLQELCVRQMWPLPDYTVSRHGPDHNPRFRASVTVNGVSFDAPDLSKSSKEAQDKVAQAAVDHFAVSLPPESSPQPPEISVSYKAQLNVYAQKKCIDIPKYEAVREGLDHIPCFKANVSVDNKSFSSEQFFRTLKEAENNAAKVALAALSLAENTQAANCTVGSLSLDGVAKVRNDALNAAHRSLSPDGNRKEEPNFYKNFLQELAQKEGILLPKYSTKSHGESHMPCFSSKVEIGGETYMGDLAKTKKQAEMSAAKAAWVELQKNKSEEGGNTIENKSSTGDTSSTLHYDQRTNSSKEIMKNDDSIDDSVTLQLQKLGIEITEVDLFEDRTSSSFGDSAPTDSVTAEVHSTSPIGGVGNSLQCNLVCVYPNVSGLVLPEGASLLPFSDDKWVAVSLDFSNHEGGISV